MTKLILCQKCESLNISGRIEQFLNYDVISDYTFKLVCNACSLVYISPPIKSGNAKHLSEEFKKFISQFLFPVKLGKEWYEFKTTNYEIKKCKYGKGPGLNLICYSIGHGTLKLRNGSSDKVLRKNIGIGGEFKGRLSFKKQWSVARHGISSGLVYEYNQIPLILEILKM
jgi:hypothetical protein